jgi:hypothetical protein
MPRPLALFCLILALGGPLANQERVADGLSRALADRMGCVVLESSAEDQDEDEASGDLGIVAMKVGADRPNDLLALPFSCVLTLDQLPLPSRISGETGATWSRRCLSSWPPPGAERRQSLLQVFLF